MLVYQRVNPRWLQPWVWYSMVKYGKPNHKPSQIGLKKPMTHREKWEWHMLEVRGTTACLSRSSQHRCLAPQCVRIWPRGPQAIYSLSIRFKMVVWLDKKGDQWQIYANMGMQWGIIRINIVPIGSMVLLYMVTWIPSIYLLHVSIYTSTMDPMG